MRVVLIGKAVRKKSENIFQTCFPADRVNRYQTATVRQGKRDMMEFVHAQMQVQLRHSMRSLPPVIGETLTAFNWPRNCLQGDLLFDQEIHQIPYGCGIHSGNREGLLLAVSNGLTYGSGIPHHGQEQCFVRSHESPTQTVRQTENQIMLGL